MITTSQFIDEVLIEADKVKNQVEEKFNSLSSDQLNFRTNKDSWSIGECFNHLLITNSSYSTKIESVVKDNINTEQKDHPFKHTLIGKLIIKSVRPETTKKTKTASDFNPINSEIDKGIISQFLEQHKYLTSLIEKSKNIDLRKIKIISPFSSLVKYNLGDAYLIIMLHNQRHIQQAEKIMKSENFPGN